MINEYLVTVTVNCLSPEHWIGIFSCCRSHHPGNNIRAVTFLLLECCSVHVEWKFRAWFSALRVMRKRERRGCQTQRPGASTHNFTCNFTGETCTLLIMATDIFGIRNCQFARFTDHFTISCICNFISKLGTVCAVTVSHPNPRRSCTQPVATVFYYM